MVLFRITENEPSKMHNVRPYVYSRPWMMLLFYTKDIRMRFCSGLKGPRPFWLLNHPAKGVLSLDIRMHQLERKDLFTINVMLSGYCFI